MTLDNILLRRLLLGVIGVLFLSVILFCVVGKVKADSLESAGRTFHCASVYIDNNDTLWSIAQEYYTSEYDDIESYIDEIKKSNGLCTDNITAGKYLLVPHYR